MWIMLFEWEFFASQDIIPEKCCVKHFFEKFNEKRLKFCSSKRGHEYYDMETMTKKQELT